MKTIALVVAGGVGSRMGDVKPKQFIEVLGKPVLFYTLENFQRSDVIDEIVLVCISGWDDFVKDKAKEYGVDKLSAVVEGGASVQESIRNGVFFLEDYCDKEDIVVIHDGIRPLVDDFVLTDVVNVCKQYGASVSSLPYNEQIFLVDNDISTVKYIPRETLRRVSTPQAYKFGNLDARYHEAFEKKIGIYGSSYTNTMMVELGERLYFASGSEKNIKLTTPDDLELFKAYLLKNENEAI